MGAFWSQLLPPPPTFTEFNIPALHGRVFIITGGNAGVGFCLAKMLYSAGGCTIYIASRSASRIQSSISEISTTASTPAATPSTLKPLVVDFADLRTIAPAVSEFLAHEQRLDVLWNNAGVAQQPPGSTTAQGYEIHMGTNCLGPFLFTQLLLPLLTKTAQDAPSSSIRVIFTSSQIIDTTGPMGGIRLSEQEAHATHLHTAMQDKNYTYACSKIGNWYLAAELDKRVRAAGVVSVAVNPGNVRTKGWDPVSWDAKLLIAPFLYDPQMGAYTELWAGLAEQVTTSDGGKLGVPWGGRWHPGPRRDLLDGLRRKVDWGSGVAGEFWEWCEVQTRGFAGDEERGD
ncbi:NAD(P)-binding protein [Lophiostoma macrostomum CBS 122681]|uniref:NAD(P)-binding protein n=1 Tax=Lophiostoma macrostomum CBS 122681 TaxID=1314788 RepID=A0A6A6TB34_9PLEO|nr:NAD(P)-binding protein [Lophiostoma macrostomum CBS 122681]